MLVSNGYINSIDYEVKFFASVGVTSFSPLVEWSSVGFQICCLI